MGSGAGSSEEPGAVSRFPCSACGDLYVAGTQHDCWVLKKIDLQEHLPNPGTSDFVAERPILSDADWHARHTA